MTKAQENELIRHSPRLLAGNPWIPHLWPWGMTLLILVGGLSLPTLADGFWQKLTWTNDDGVQLVGEYHPASRASDYTWVLLHGLGSTKEEWDAFARQAAGTGNGFFLYDARGHGASIYLKSGSTITYKDWQTAGPGSQWNLMPGDLAFIFQKLQKKFSLPENQIAVGGASLGANVALIYASNHPAVPALILLSPGLEYAGIQTPSAFYAYRGRPVFIAASPGDTYAYSSVQRLSDLVPKDMCLTVDGKSGHGVNMFEPEFTNKLLDWMKGLHGNRNRRPS
jgi:pimeloyl-ACP methyl ester carboxylesterase